MSGIPIQLCHACGYVFDAASPLADKGAEPGFRDISLCLNCGAAAIFEKNMIRRPMTEADIEKLPERLRKLIRLAQKHCFQATNPGRTLVQRPKGSA